MQPTPAQRNHVAKTFNELANAEAIVLRAFKDPRKLKHIQFTEYERLIKLQQDNFVRSQDLSVYINKIDSDKPLFNLFQGELDLARHTLSPAVLGGILGGIENFKYVYYTEDERKIEPPPEIDWDKQEERTPLMSSTDALQLPRWKESHEDMISMLRFSINCFKIFAKIASEDFKPKRFRLKPIVDKVLAERRVFGHHRKAALPAVKLDVNVENVLVEFDPDAFYWIMMRMISNAEHATEFTSDAWIELRTYKHTNGNFYLIMKNNGMTIKERAERSKFMHGGRSMPNIKKITSLLKSDYILTGFPDHTRACIRLPLAKVKI